MPPLACPSLDDASGNTTTWAYDNVGYVTMETNELGKTRSFWHDAAGNLTRKIDRNNRVTQYASDDLDRQTAEKWLSSSTVPSLAVATTTQGGPTNEVQRVGYTISGYGGSVSGTFTLSFGGQTTSGIAYNASAATVQTALTGLSSIGSGNVAVVKSQDSYGNQEWTLTFQGSLAGANQSQVTVDKSLISVMYATVTATQATDTNGGSAGNEVQTVTLSNASDGTIRLAFMGQTTGPLAYNASASTVQTALTGLSTIGSGNAAVSGSGGGPWTVTFQGALAGINVQQLQGDAASAQNGSVSRTIAYTYDAASELTAVSDGAASYAYVYDNIGRLTSDTQSVTGLTPSIVMTSTWDAASNRASLAASIGGTADYKNDFTLDNLLRPTRIVQQGQSGGNTLATKRIDFAYDAGSRLTTLDRFQNTGGTNNVAQTTFSYDSLNQLSTLDHKQGSTTLAGYAYSYDHANRLTSVNSSVEGTSSFTFDATSQVTAATHAGQSNESYSFDATGNRNTSGVYTVSAGNHITSDGTYNYTYDDEGNRTRRTKISDGSITDYAWDYRNRLTNVTEKPNVYYGATKSTDYTYDVFNRLVKRSHDPDGAGSQTASDTYYAGYFGDGAEFTLQFSGSAASNLSHRYLFAPGVNRLLSDENVTSLSSAGNVLWALADHLGTVRDIADQNESTYVTTVSNHRTYNSFGLLVAETNSGVQIALGYTAQLYDAATGLQYNWNRWYDARMGQWLTEDPIGFGGGDVNLRRYVGNAGVLYYDPTGLERTFFDRTIDFIAGQRGDGLDMALNGTDQFASGMSSSLTGGLTDRAREAMYGEIATQNHEGGLRIAGELTGTGMSIVIGAGNPCAVGGMAGNGMRVLAAADAIGSSIQVGEDLRDGNYGSAALNAVGIIPGVGDVFSACFVPGTQVAVRPLERPGSAADLVFAAWGPAALWGSVAAIGVGVMAASIGLEYRRRKRSQQKELAACHEALFGQAGASDWLGELLGNFIDSAATHAGREESPDAVLAIAR